MSKNNTYQAFALPVANNVYAVLDLNFNIIIAAIALVIFLPSNFLAGAIGSFASSMVFIVILLKLLRHAANHFMIYNAQLQCLSLYTLQGWIPHKEEISVTDIKKFAIEPTFRTNVGDFCN